MSLQRLRLLNSAAWAQDFQPLLQSLEGCSAINSQDCTNRQGLTDCIARGTAVCPYAVTFMVWLKESEKECRKMQRLWMGGEPWGAYLRALLLQCWLLLLLGQLCRQLLVWSMAGD